MKFICINKTSLYKSNIISLTAKPILFSFTIKLLITILGESTNTIKEKSKLEKKNNPPHQKQNFLNYKIVGLTSPPRPTHIQGFQRPLVQQLACKTSIFTTTYIFYLYIQPHQRRNIGIIILLLTESFIYHKPYLWISKRDLLLLGSYNRLSKPNVHCYITEVQVFCRIRSFLGSGLLQDQVFCRIRSFVGLSLLSDQVFCRIRFFV